VDFWCLAVFDMQHAFRMNISTLDMMKILVSLRYQMDSNGNS